MFRTETHLHVSEVSPCAQVSAVAMMKLCADSGYKTVFVSDHLKQSFCDALGDIPWQEKMSIFLSGFYRAQQAGKAYGLNVLMSAEICFADNPNHYLVYGIDKAFLDSLPELCRMSARDFFDIATERGALVIQAHPFRDGECFPTPDCVHGFEVYNSNPRHQDFSDKSVQCAAEHGVYTTAGSDSHRTEDVGRGGIVTEEEIRTAEDFIACIKSGNFELFKG